MKRRPATEPRRSARRQPVIPIVAGVLRLVWEASPAALCVTLALSVVTACLPPLAVWLGKHLVDLVVAGAARGSTANGRVIVPTVIGLGATAGALRALGTIQSNRQLVFGSIVELHAERRLLERIASTDLENFDRPEWYDRAARATGELGNRPFNLAVSLIGVVGASVTLAGMLVLLATVSPALAALSVVAVLPSAYAQRVVGRRVHELWRHTTTEDRRRQYLRDLLSHAATAPEVRAYGLRDHLLARHRASGDIRLGAMRRVHAHGERIVVLGAVLTGAGLAAAYGLVASRALHGHLSAGDLTLLIGAFGAASAQMGTLFGSALELDRGAAFLEDYFSLLGAEPRLPVAENPVPIPRRLTEGVAFDGVTFTYPGRDTPALSDVTLRVPPGQLLALVGENGAGKTTLVKLLLRLYDPQAGVVSVGGIDVRQVDPDDLRRRIGVLFQDFPRYELTARENVTMGRVEREATDEAVLGALEVARAGPLVSGLDRGLDSYLGRMFEDSRDLSGGEWQRLALARLLYRDADIWVLDEPTSALDAGAEASIFSALRLLLHDRVGILISHRFSTVRVADQIAVVSDGRITEIGTHDELVAAGGSYARLFELQAAGYR